MLSNPHRVQYNAPWPPDKDQYVIHDMTIAETRVDPNTLPGDGLNVLKMTEDLDDILSSLSKPNLGEDSLKIPKELRNTRSIQNQSSKDFGSDTDRAYPLEQALPSGTISGRSQEMSLAMERKISKLREAHPWHPAELVSKPAEHPCVKEPGRTQEGEARYLDGAADAEEDKWSIEASVGDLDEDMDGAHPVATETAETL